MQVPVSFGAPTLDARRGPTDLGGSPAPRASSRTALNERAVSSEHTEKSWCCAHSILLLTWSSRLCSAGLIPCLRKSQQQAQPERTEHGHGYDFAARTIRLRREVEVGGCKSSPKRVGAPVFVEFPLKTFPRLFFSRGDGDGVLFPSYAVLLLLGNYSTQIPPSLLPTVTAIALLRRRIPLAQNPSKRDDPDARENDSRRATRTTRNYSPSICTSFLVLSPPRRRNVCRAVTLRLRCRYDALDDFPPRR